MDLPILKNSGYIHPTSGRLRFKVDMDALYKMFAASKESAKIAAYNKLYKEYKPYRVTI